MRLAGATASTSARVRCHRVPWPVSSVRPPSHARSRRAVRAGPAGEAVARRSPEGPPLQRRCHFCSRSRWCWAFTRLRRPPRSPAGVSRSQPRRCARCGSLPAPSSPSAAPSSPSPSPSRRRPIRSQKTWCARSRRCRTRPPTSSGCTRRRCSSRSASRASSASGRAGCTATSRAESEHGDRAARGSHRLRRRGHGRARPPVRPPRGEHLQRRSPRFRAASSRRPAARPSRGALTAGGGSAANRRPRSVTATMTRHVTPSPA